MNKFFFPTTLIAVLAIAMVFAIVPVDNAQTLHLPTIGSAQIATDSIAATDIAAGAVATSEILDDNVQAADLAPNSVLTTAALPFSHKESTTLTGTVTDAINPGHTSSTALVWCSIGVTPVGHTVTNPSLTLVIAGGTGAISGTASKVITDVVADGANYAMSAQWAVTGITDASTLRCDAAGTLAVDGDIFYNTITAIYFPQT